MTIEIQGTHGGRIEIHRTPDRGIKVVIDFEDQDFGPPVQRTMLPHEATAFAAAVADVAARRSDGCRTHLEGPSLPDTPGVIVSDDKQYIDVSPWDADLFGLSWAFIDSQGESAIGGTTIAAAAMDVLNAGLRKMFGLDDESDEGDGSSV